MWCWLGLRPDSFSTLSSPACVSGWTSPAPQRPGRVSARCTRTWRPRCPRRRCTGGLSGLSAVSPPPQAGRRSPGPGRLRLEMTSGNFLWCYFSSLMFCFFILNYLFSFLFTIICLYPTLQYRFLCNIEIMFPDIIGDHAPKIGDGVITFTLILIPSHEYQCMLSPNNEKKYIF